MSGRILVGQNSPLKVKQRTIGEFIFELADQHPSKLCQISYDSGEEETFASVKKRSIRTALELKKRGVTSNDLIAFCSRNTMDNCIPLIATAYLGATFSSLDPDLSVVNLKHLLTLIQPKFLFVDEESLDLIERISNDDKLEEKLIVFGDSTKYSTFDEFLQPSTDEDSFKPTIVDSNETAAILFSSGTTGLPKAIRLTHLNLFYRINEQLKDNSNDPNLLMLCFASTYWISGLLALLFSFTIGFGRVIMKHFDPEETLKAIEKYKITFLFITPTAAYKLINDDCVDKFEIKHLVVVIIVGSRISLNARKVLETIFKTSIITCPYATTESGGIAGFDVRTDDIKLNQVKISSCGKVVSGAMVKVVDPDTEEILGPNQKGEIRCKSPQVMSGYINVDPNEVFDADGFYKTGDIGYYDDDECFYVVDRIKEIFKYKNNIIVPIFIEMVLLEHPAIVEACVFSIPVPDCVEHGEYPTACVVLKPNQTVSIDEIHNFVNERVLEHERLIGGVTIVDSIPLTPSGKMMKRLLREQFINSLNK